MQHPPAPLRCFELVLDALHQDVEALVPRARTDMQDAFRRMSARYRSVWSRGGPDFSDGLTRLAYVYTYTPSQAHWVYRTLAACPQVRRLATQREVRVAALGGGPGTDVLGLLKFLASHGRRPAVSCEVFDRCPAWASEWSRLHGTLAKGEHVHPGQVWLDYVPHDFRLQRQDVDLDRLAEADVVFASFLLSELVHAGDRVAQVAGQVFARLKPGAFVVINDNLDPSRLARLDQLARQCGLAVVHCHYSHANVHPDEDLAPRVEAFRAHLGWSPKSKGALGTRVYVRPAARAAAPGPILPIVQSTVGVRRVNP